MVAFDRTETANHCRRVCALSLQMSGILRLGEELKEALRIAASLHQFCGPAFQEPAFQEDAIAGIFEQDPSLTPAMPANNDILRLAGKILLSLKQPGLPAGSGIPVAAEVLHAADLVDEAVEYGIFESLTPAEAITKFHEEVGDCFHPPLREALRAVTCGTPFVLSRAILPVMPKAALKLMRTSDETSPRELEQIASLDPVLAGRLLEVANSARFGPEQPIMRLAEAAARVGVPMARRILYGACFGKLFASKALHNLWQKSQTVATLASAGAQLADLDSEVAYAAGLLHDIGRIVFEAADAPSRVAVLNWLERGFPLTYAEALTYATDHASAGAEMLRGWGLPEAIVTAVENHHQPERTGSPLASLVYLAEQWHLQKTGESHDLFRTIRSEYAARITGIAPDYPSRRDIELEVLSPSG